MIVHWTNFLMHGSAELKLKFTGDDRIPHLIDFSKETIFD